MERRTLVADPDCCCGGGPGEPCDVCDSCPALIGTDWCMCLTLLEHTPVGGDCLPFSITFSPPICLRGACGTFPNIVVMQNTTTITVGTLTWPPGHLSVTIKCLNSGGTLYQLVLVCTPTMTGCTLPGVSFAFIASTSDCNADAFIGNYDNTFFDSGTSDTMRIVLDVYRGVGCPPP
jgi:hypothetical protein